MWKMHENKMNVAFLSQKSCGSSEIGDGQCYTHCRYVVGGCLRNKTFSLWFQMLRFLECGRTLSLSTSPRALQNLSGFGTLTNLHSLSQFLFLHPSFSPSFSPLLSVLPFIQTTAQRAQISNRHHDRFREFKGDHAWFLP